MKFGRKLTATAAVVGLAASLTLIGSSPAGAQGQVQIQVDCRGVPGSEAEILITAVPDLFPGGVVPIPATITADVPADLPPGGSGAVTFGWELNPGSELVSIATTPGVDIESIDGQLLEVSVSQSGGSGGPYPFDATAHLAFQPTPIYPVVTAGGQISVGESPVSYSFNIGRLDLTTFTPNPIAGQPDLQQLLELDCNVAGSAVIAGTAVGGVAPPDVPPGGGGSGSGDGGGDSGGAAGPSTTLRQGTTGASQSRVTG